ncbi:MAG: hypothetical protein SF162_00930 [bacterium]|nr:hypothetical protein [bacterium]
MNDSVIVWVHGDALSPTNPALEEFPGAPAVFVWDDALLRRYGTSLKRIVFMYECLLEMPVTLLRGDVAAQVIAFAQAHDAARVVTTDSPSPHFESILTRIEQVYPVEVIVPDELIDDDVHLDLGSFSRYWRTAQKYAFGRGGD